MLLACFLLATCYAALGVLGPQARGHPASAANVSGVVLYGRSGFTGSPRNA